MSHRWRWPRGVAAIGRRPWSVRAYLIASVVAALVLLGVLQAVLAVHSLHKATKQARTRAAFEASLASDQVRSGVEQAESVLAGVAGSFDLPDLLANPSACTLSFAGSQGFNSGHIDVVLPDGTVVCSSLYGHGAPSGATQKGAPWVAAAATLNPGGSMTTGVFTDGLTNKPSIALVSPMRDSTRPGSYVGVVAVVLAVGPMADGLSAQYGGPEHYSFAITDASGALVSSSGPPDAIPVHGSRDGWIVASRTVDALGWHIVAGRRSSAALGPTRSLLLSEGLLAGLALLVVLALLGLVYRQIARPLRRFAHAVNRVGREVAPQPVEVGGPAELRQVAEQFNVMIEARASFEDKLTHDALHDPLTGLPNQVLLLDRLAIACEQAEAGGAKVAVLSIGVDRFELVNASLGYLVGDSALVALATRIEGALRPRQTLARLGGGEFAIALLEVADRDAALAEAAAVLRAVAQPLDAAGTMLSLTASIGVAVGEGQVGAEDLLRNATTAMHSAKEHGGARYELFETSLRVQASTRLRLENDLSRALDRGELFVEYQPVVNLPSGRVTGAEALVRWRHPTRGIVSPATFIPLAEETGAIERIGEFVLEQACAQAAAWRESGYRMRVAVNVSGRQLLGGDFAEKVTRTLRATQLPPSQLCLELTESTLMEDVLRISTALHALKGHGVSVSVDDFGTGYSSLSYLQRFPVDELKIDRAFVVGLGEPDDRNLVAAVIGIAHALELRVIAEGVETQEQMTQLLTMGCRSAQGFYFGKPQSPEALTTMLPRQHIDLGSARTG